MFRMYEMHFGMSRSRPDGLHPASGDAHAPIGPGRGASDLREPLGVRGLPDVLGPLPEQGGYPSGDGEYPR